MLTRSQEFTARYFADGLDEAVVVDLTPCGATIKHNRGRKAGHLKSLVLLEGMRS
jgi:hypothetical protein